MFDIVGNHHPVLGKSSAEKRSHAHANSTLFTERSTRYMTRARIAVDIH